MSGTTVDWGLGAALALVASVAGRRVLLRLAAPGRSGGRVVPSGRQFFDASMHLAMALGMAVMLLPGGVIARPVLVSGFTGLALALLGDGIRSLVTGAAGPDAGRTVARRGAGGRVVRGRHRLHHAAMAGIMVLMVLGPHASSGGVGGGTGTMAGMAMASSTSPAAGVVGAGAAAGHGVPLTLLAAFGYACVSALVFAWRVPAVVPAGGRGAGSAAADGDSGFGCGHGEAADLLGRSCEIIMFISTAVMLFPMI